MNVERVWFLAELANFFLTVQRRTYHSWWECGNVFLSLNWEVVCKVWVLRVGLDQTTAVGDEANSAPQASHKVAIAKVLANQR